MAIVKFTPDRQPRRGDENGHMTVWQVLLLFFDWVNSNYVQQFKAGVATVLAGNTAVVVNHGLGVSAYRVAVVPNGADAGARWWVSNKIGSSFQINLSAAAPVGGIVFDWIVKGD